VCACSRIGEEQGNVLGADVATVDTIGRACAPLDTTGNFYFAVASDAYLTEDFSGGAFDKK
jgi:hypothetical protein